MDEASFNYPILYRILNYAMLLGGSIAAIFVVRYHLRHPPDRQQCGETIVSRSWKTMHMGILLASLILLYIIASFFKQYVSVDQIALFELVAILCIYSTHLLIITGLNRIRGGTWLTGFGMGRKRLKALILSPVLYLAMIPFIMIATEGYHWMLQNWFGQELSLQDTAQVITEESSWIELGYILAAIIAAPLYEEVLFRGLLFPYLARRIGLIGSMCVVSVLFALIHNHLPSSVPLFMLSVGLCLAYWRTGSLWTSIGIHAVFNAVGSLALKLMG